MFLTIDQIFNDVLPFLAVTLTGYALGRAGIFYYRNKDGNLD